MTRLTALAVPVFLLARAALATSCEEADKKLRAWSPAPADAAELSGALQREVSSLQDPKDAEAYCRTVIADLAEKTQARAQGVTLSPAEIEKHTLEYEHFRFDTYLSSGVSPKRYFGFFDGQGDTAAFERILRDTVHDAVPILNDYAREQRLSARISDKEAAITFLAEGGALLLTDGQDHVNRVHPVRDIGLDSFRDGFARYPKLVARLDEHFGTRLANLSIHVGGTAVLLRPMTFREAILGTAIMYLYEKELTAGLLAQDKRPPLSSLSLDRQFVTTSFVYNAGLLFSDQRVNDVMNFSTAAYLADVNVQNRGQRPWLPVSTTSEARQRLRSGEAIPQQLTSWSAVYHVLQRYGAWVAVARFSDTFDDNGNFRLEQPHAAGP